jgi:disulfide bond formation protein DsbB
MAGIWNLLIMQDHRREALALQLNPPPAKLNPASYARGQQLYAMACVACHGAEGRGVERLGKDLTHSRFARGMSDEQFVQFVIAGRGIDDPLNTTKVPMPPRGGRADFSDQNLADVVTYVRGLADPRRVPAGPLPTVEVVLATPAPEPAEAARTTPSASSLAPAVPTANVTSASSVSPEAVARGKRAFVSCMACHGKDGKGVKNMGKDLVASPFVGGLGDAALVDFIKKGRGPTDPGNTTHVAMPPKGGNPALKDEQIRDIVAYIRSLRGASVSAAVAAATPSSPVASAGSSSPAANVAASTAVTATPASAAAAATPAPSARPAAPVVATVADASRGKKAFISCMACHGKDARGVKNLGKDLVTSPFVSGQTDDSLLDFIKKGRMPTDPGNTTKVAMPPKGGNPALKDDQIRDIIAYLRSLRQSAKTE